MTGLTSCLDYVIVILCSVIVVLILSPIITRLWIREKILDIFVFPFIVIVNLAFWTSFISKEPIFRWINIWVAKPIVIIIIVSISICVIIIAVLSVYFTAQPVASRVFKKLFRSKT